MRSSLIDWRGGRTQKHMALIAGVSQQTWSNWENGSSTLYYGKMKQIGLLAGRSVEQLFLTGQTKINSGGRDEPK